MPRWRRLAGHVPRADGRHEHLHAGLTSREVFAQTTFREPALSSASQAGLVNNLNFGLSWGLLTQVSRAGRHRRHRHVRALGGRDHAAGRRDGDGLPDPARRHRRLAHPTWRGWAVGVYRVWRDLGHAVGASMGGVVAGLPVETGAA